MKSLRQSKNKKRIPKIILIAAIAVGVILIGSAVWFFFFNKQQNATVNGGVDGVNVIDYNPPTKEERQATEEQKDAIIKEQENQSTPTDASLGVIISRSFQDVSGYNLRTVVDGTKNGDCTATFTKSGQPTVTKTFTITFEATNAFCKDAIIPLSDFSASGTWDLSLVVKKDNKQSPPATASVEITK
jgi:hypothetical protein